MFYLNPLKFIFFLSLRYFPAFTTHKFSFHRAHTPIFLKIINCQRRTAQQILLPQRYDVCVRFNLVQTASRSTLFASFAKTRPFSYSKAPDIFSQIVTIPRSTRGINCPASFFFPLADHVVAKCELVGLPM